MEKRKRRWRRIPPEKKREVIRLRAGGATYPEIVEALDLALGSVELILQPLGGVIRREMWEPKNGRLSLEERIDIYMGIKDGEALRAIARRLGRNPSTVCREVNANGGRKGYGPVRAHHRAERRSKRPKVTKLAANPRLCARVITDLQSLWSPQQISTRLREEFGDDDTMNISHETIYKSVYVQGRGELRRELARCLRSGRATRVPRDRRRRDPKIKDMVMISERPAEVEDRAVLGHWEGDLIMGRNNKSAIGTLVERSTRFVMLFRPKRQTAEEVRAAMTELVQTLPDALRRSITWDQGREMAEHARFSIDTGVQIYFCDPHSPWQRGSNENTNGLLRQYFPKGTSFRNVTDEQLKAAADSLNGRPRQTLGWRTPAEKLDELLR